MPHFDAARSSTNDVVRQALIPWSLLGGAWPALRKGQGDVEALGVSMAQRMGPRKAQVMVTHNWDNLFSHLVAATLASAMGQVTYESVLRLMAKPCGIQESLDSELSEGVLKAFLLYCLLFMLFHVCHMCLHLSFDMLQTHNIISSILSRSCGGCATRSTC